MKKFISRYIWNYSAGLHSKDGTLRIRSKNWDCSRAIRLRALVIEQLEDRLAFAGDTVSVFAAGATGQETLQLLIDGAVVQTWNNVGGNIQTPSYRKFTYVASGSVLPEQIRVAFTNDVSNPPAADRDLRVDRIQVNAKVYQTEAPTVYSTGTRVAGNVTPGFPQSEFLNVNGYFQYGAKNGSTIKVIAAGSTGNENLQLQVDGQVVSSWDQIGGNSKLRQFKTFTYLAPGPVTADQVRVAFTNDLNQPPVNYSLTVDKIIVDSVTFETEDLATYSTGTYVAEQLKVVPGYWGSERLAKNGYFQYAARVVNFGDLGLESSVYEVRENEGSIAISVVRTGGSVGAVSIDYRTVDVTALSGSDYIGGSGTIRFAEGETRKTVSIPLINDVVREAPETFNVVIENPVGGGRLLAPRTATITIIDDDLTLPNFPSFPTATAFQLNGSASIKGNTLRLSDQVRNQIGSAFYTTPIPINADTSFQTQFQFRGVGISVNGSDGLTFTFQNSALGATAIGQPGNDSGYAGIAKSLAIEFESIKSPGQLNDNHLSVWHNGDVVYSIGTKSSKIEFNSGSTIYAWIDYSGESDFLAVYVASTPTKPTDPLFGISFDLLATVGGRAYVGFTGGTSNSVTSHQIQSWQFNLDRPVFAPVVLPKDLVTETVVSALSQPTSIDFSPDGRNLYVAQKEGLVRVVRDGVLLPSPFIDIQNRVNSHSDRGLLAIAVHPDFANNPYIYLLFTYDPPEVYQNASDSLAGPDKPGNRAGRLIRVTADSATNFTTVVPNSDVILLGKNSIWKNYNGFINSTIDLNSPQGGVNPDGTYINDFIVSDSQSHTVGSLAFSPDGSLYVSIGDGASYNSVDPRGTRVQDIDSLSGKILRINPINGNGYASNPFFDENLGSNRSKVYQLGLRNPFRISVNSNTNQLFVGDVGWFTWEEINSAGPGANFGWPYYEGGDGFSSKTVRYQDLAKARAFYKSGEVVTPSILALNHAADGINAIVLGAAYTGNTYPAHYKNNVFFNDLGQGIVRAATLDSNGKVTNVETFAIGAQYVTQIIQGRDGNLYFVDLDDGIVGRWTFKATSTPAEQVTAGATAAWSIAVTAVPSVTSGSSTSSASSPTAPTSTQPAQSSPSTSQVSTVISAQKSSSIAPSSAAAPLATGSTTKSVLDELTLDAISRDVASNKLSLAANTLKVG